MDQNLAYGSAISGRTTPTSALRERGDWLTGERRGGGRGGAGHLLGLGTVEGVGVLDELGGGAHGTIEILMLNLGVLWWQALKAADVAIMFLADAGAIRYT